jgi:hypothetical protein
MMKFYEGQSVRITDNSCAHGINLGTIVKLTSVEEMSDGSFDLYADGWVFDQDDCEPVNVTNKFTGAEIAELVVAWANDNRMHPDDFSMLFAEELLERLEADK